MRLTCLELLSCVWSFLFSCHEWAGLYPGEGLCGKGPRQSAVRKFCGQIVINVLWECQRGSVMFISGHGTH